jgi:hypothetical protein
LENINSHLELSVFIKGLQANYSFFGDVGVMIEVNGLRADISDATMILDSQNKVLIIRNKKPS